MLACLVLLGPRYATAAPLLRLQSTSDFVDLAPYVDVYEDPTGAQSFESVAAQRFVPVKRIDLPDANSTYWLRFRYLNAGSGPWVLTAGYRPTHADLFVPGVLAQPQHSGDVLPIAERAVPVYNWVAFNLPSSPRERVAYLRLTTYEPLVNLVAYTRARFAADTTRDVVVIAALLGVLGTLVLSSIVLFFVMRDTLYLYYAAYIAAQFVYRANDFGLISSALFPHWSLPYVRSEVFFDGLTLVVATAFIRRFLRSQSYSRTLDRVNIAIAVVGGTYALAALIGIPVRYTLVQNFSFVYVPVWIATGIVCLRSDYAPARLFLFAWTAYMIGIVVEAAVDLGMGVRLGIVRESRPDVVLDYLVYLGIAVESMLLSLSLAQAYRGANEEKIAGLHELIAMRERTEKMALLAYNDALTTLPNRAAFLERVDEALHAASRHDRRCALLYIDLNNFKAVNDTFGHQCGDRVLVESAGRLRNTIRGDEMVGRIGGDEFSVFVPSIEDDAQVGAIYERILDAFKEPFDIGANLVTVGVSVGVSYYPDPCLTREALFAAADAAMYARKTQTFPR